MLVASEPDKFQMPSQSDMRYHWVHVRLDALDEQEAHELVIDAWRMVVPKRVALNISGAEHRNFERNGHLSMNLAARSAWRAAPWGRTVRWRSPPERADAATSGPRRSSRCVHASCSR